MFDFLKKQSEVLGGDCSSDVDPIAEAEVYFAYGRYEQGLKILTEAYQKTKDERVLNYINRVSKNKTDFVLEKNSKLYRYYVNVMYLDERKETKLNRFIVEIARNFNSKIGIELMEKNLEDLLKTKNFNIVSVFELED